MRDWMFLVGLIFLLPLAVTNGFAAFLIWGWTSMISIDDYLYGFMSGFRLNLLFGIISIAFLVLKKNRDKILLEGNLTFVLLIVFLVHGFLCASLAYAGNSLNWILFERFAKALVFALIIPFVVLRRYHIHAFVIVIALGLGFHGLIDGLKFIASGGGHNVRGFAKFGDNNHFAVLLVMVIPLVLYIARYSVSRVITIAALLISLVIVAAVVGTSSRGGFISLAAMGLWWVVTSRQKVAGTLIVVTACAIVLVMAPTNWTDRMGTIKAADEDTSFMTRVEAWQVSSAIALSNPVFGGGFHAVQVQSVWSQFRGQGGLLGFVDTGLNSAIFRAAHSVYFEVLGDMGFLGFILFISLIGMALVNLRRVREVCNRHNGQLAWADDLSRALTSVLIGFLVGGAAVSIAYYEIVYTIFMLCEVLRREVVESAKQFEKSFSSKITDTMKAS